MKSESYQTGAEMREPSPWSLFQAINGLVQFANMIGVLGVMITRRL